MPDPLCELRLDAILQSAHDRRRRREREEQTGLAAAGAVSLAGAPSCQHLAGYLPAVARATAGRFVRCEWLVSVSTSDYTKSLSDYTKSLESATH
jgi:hypothetical protein